MDATAFADLPIVIGQGRGPAVVGATLDELRAALGEPDAVDRYGNMAYPAWHALGVQAWIENDRAIAIVAYCGDPSSPKFAQIAGRTEQGAALGATEDAIVAAHGAPLLVHKGADRGKPWKRLTYDGASFRLVDDKLVSITLQKAKLALAMEGRNLELEAAIGANPDDSAGYLVYADWLQQQNDPLGELIVGHHHGGDDYVAEHETDLLGSLADYKDMLDDCEWKNGFLRRVKVANTFDRSPLHDGELEEFDVVELLEMVLDEAGRFVQDLTVGIVDYEDNGYDGVMAAIGKRKLLALRTLYLGDFHSEETELNWSSLGNAEVLYGGIPNVRDLTLRSGTMHFGTIVLPELRRFATLTGGLQKDAIASIAGAHWPELERLELQIGSSRYDSNITPDDLQPILDGEGLPATLVHLGLANYEFTNELIPRLVSSKILPRIRELDLSQGSFGPEGAEALIANKAAFAHLDKLDLSESWLDTPIAARVREALPKAITADQRYDPRYPEDRYIAAGE